MKKIYSEKDLMSLCREQPKTILYGCGNVGKKIWSWLQWNEIEVYCFAVTEKKELDDYIDGLKVREINELTASKDACVIVATMEKSQDDIIMILREIGFENIACMTDRAYREVSNKEQRVKGKLRFQIHVTEHCNLNCRGCYHFSSLAEEEYLDLTCYENDLKWLAKLFDGEMSEILLLGGEPLLHPEMAEILNMTREYFPVGTIKILSNGILLEKMPEKFWKAVSVTDTELWLTKYPITLDYDKIEKIAHEHDADIQYFNREPVRTLGHQPLDVEGNQEYKKNFDSCYRKNNCVFLENGKLYTCIIPGCIRHFNKYFNTDLKVCEEDYVDIYSVKSKEELLDKLLKPIPFCRYCDRNDVSVFGVVPWQQTQFKIEEWIR